MRKPTDPEEARLLSKLVNGGRTNISEWVESICHDFCEDEAIQTSSSLQSIQNQFFSELHDNFFCILPVLIHKLLIEKDAAHIVEPRPPLERRPNTNSEERERAWQRFVQEREWEHFLRK